jgi:hypothetical protein
MCFEIKMTNIQVKLEENYLLKSQGYLNAWCGGTCLKSAFRRLRQDCQFEASVNYRVRPCPPPQKKRQIQKPNQKSKNKNQNPKHLSFSYEYP